MSPIALYNPAANVCRLRTLQGQDFTRFGSLAAQLQALPQQQQVQTMTQAFSQALAANPVGSARAAGGLRIREGGCCAVDVIP